jgi:HD-GYP domain-containing protein (c-di-GMP phosphodiesterase class II)
MQMRPSETHSETIAIETGQRQGERVLAALFRLLQAVRIHQSNNILVTKAAAALIEALGAFSDEGRLTLHAAGNGFYLQGEKLRYRKETAHLIDHALTFFEGRQLPGLVFTIEPELITETAVLDLTRLLNAAGQEKEPQIWIEQQLERQKLEWVEILSQPEADDADAIDAAQHLSVLMGPASESRDRQVKVAGAKQSYASAYAALQEVAGKVGGGRPAGVRKATRVVQKMVDMLIDDRFALSALTTIRMHDDYTYTHSVNVGILAMCLGLEIGIPRRTVEDIGICGLFHDLGKVDIPLSILNKPGRLDAAERAEIQQHTIRSVQQILQLRASRQVKLRVLVPPFEHHLKYDGRGYPQLPGGRRPGLISRILTIADVFDALTAPRIYRPNAFSPDVALGWMLERAGTDFDPILLKVFCNMLGTYPVGTLLEFDSGALALVKANPKEHDGTKPVVVVLASQDEGGYLAQEELDMSTMEPAPEIVRTHHPSLFGIQPAQFLL